MKENQIMTNLNIDQLKRIQRVWFASLGISDPDDYTKWIEFKIPKEYRIKNIQKIEDLHGVGERISFESVDGEIKFNYSIHNDNLVHSNFFVLFDVLSISKDYVYKHWLKQVKSILNDNWSSHNGTYRRDILKQHLYEKHYDFFYKNYPELLI